MKLSASLQRRLHWFNLPTAVLITLLQRSPIVRVAAALEERVIASPIGAVLKSIATAAAALGAVNSMAGATPLVPSSGTESGITVTVGVSVSVAYTANSALGPAASWSSSGTLPPGLSFSGAGSNAMLDGTPTTAGSYSFTIKAFGPNPGEEANYPYTILVQAAGGTAPAFTTQPATQTVSVGATVTFTIAVSGTPTPTIQWKKGTAIIAGQTGTSLVLTNVQAGDAATYTAVATNSVSSVTSTGAILTVSAGAPTVAAQPLSHTVAVGSTAVLSAEISGAGATYQWKKGTVDVPGATARQLLIANAQSGDGGSYTLTATNGSGAVTTTAAVLTVVTTSDPGRLVNVSARIVSGLDANVLLLGFVLAGDGTSGTKQVLVRGIGPTLTEFGVPAAMVDPVLEIIPQGAPTALVSNDNWGGDATVISTANAVGAFALPSATSKDSALVTNLSGGVYSAKVSGSGRTTGTVLAEIYDANSSVYNPTTPRLVNISARVPMSNDNPLIAGFVISGSTAKTVLIRAIGPFLSQYFGTAAMSDPSVELLVRVDGVDHSLYSNDNWGGAPLLASVSATVGAFALDDLASKDAVLLVTLDPGVYSAKVLGVNNASGIALVEVYEVK